MLHSHDHSHNGHSHAGHSHVPKTFGSAFAIGIGLNAFFVMVEAAFGFLANSTALLADAGHNFSDVLGLLVAWGAATLAARPPSERFTYGLKSSSILAALFNAFFLLVAVGAIAWEAIDRFGNPQPVAGATVIVVALVGILVNGATALLFASGRKGDLNIRGAYLHMVADAAVSAGVVIAGFVIMNTGWSWVDPVVSLLICAVIMWSTWSLLTDSLRLSLAAVPSGVKLAAVRTYLETLPNVSEVHDLHVWAMSTTENVLTCHIVMPSGHPGDEFLLKATQELLVRFGINHPTIQIETDANTKCPLAPKEVV